MPHAPLYGRPKLPREMSMPKYYLSRARNTGLAACPAVTGARSSSGFLIGESLGRNRQAECSRELLTFRGSGGKRTPFNVFQRGLNRGEDRIESEINQINACNRNHQAAMQYDARVKHMIEDVEQRSVLFAGVVRSENCVGLALAAHIRWLTYILTDATRRL